MTSISPTAKERDLRRVYRALDAVQDLCDAGYGSSGIETIFNLLRAIENKIANLPLKQRRRKP